MNNIDTMNTSVSQVLTSTSNKVLRNNLHSVSVVPKQ